MSSQGNRRVCPIGDCRSLVRKGVFACWWHYTKLPAPYRAALAAADREHGVLSAEYRAARAEALNWWDREEQSA